MDFTVAIAYFVGLFMVYMLARLLFVPLRVLFRLLVNALAGGLLLAVFNFVGGYWGLYLAINPVTALVAGLLGIPGLLLMVAIRYLLVL